MTSLSAILPRISAALLPSRCANPNCQQTSLLARARNLGNGIRLYDRHFCSPDCLEQHLRETLRELTAVPARGEGKSPNRMPLGLTLLSRGSLTREQLQIALQQHRESGVRLGDVVLTLGFVTERQMTSALAMQCGYPVYPLAAENPDSLPVSIPIRLLESNSMLPVRFAEEGSRLFLGFACGIQYGVLEAVGRMLSCDPVPCVIAMSEYRERMQALVSLKLDTELIFDGLNAPGEIARIIRSYSIRLGAQEVRIERCREYLWARIKGRQQLDLLFRLVQS